MRQLGTRQEYDNLIIACDVGGTNTSIALVGRMGSRFFLLHRLQHQTQKLSSLEEALTRDIEELRQHFASHPPDRVCISGAGPVRDNTCRLTNVNWTIDGNSIEKQFGIPTLVINDFTAISYGIPLLDVEDPEQITPLPLPGGELPRPHGSVYAVVGAGTGLGIGYLVEQNGRYIALPSEGGHAAFAPYDHISRELFDYVDSRVASPPGGELFVSGQGIAWTHRFFNDAGKIHRDSPIHPDNLGSGDIGAAVSRAAGDGDETAQAIMRLFIRNYARVASDAALHFLPTNGLFLAGGIATKNQRWFLENDLFITTFVYNYLEQIGTLLRRTPVYIVQDYAISLYGAAHAAYAQEGIHT